jgi:hypothetical protein
MAKKTPIEVAPVSDASIPTIDYSHKDPAQRAHVWERPARIDERPAPVDPHADYAHALPRWIHKGGEQKFVTTPDECEAAKADGWLIDPNEAA